MTRYKFIFSDRPDYRISRHLAFWAVLLLHFIIQNLMVGGINEALKPRSYFDSFTNALYFFPAYIVSVYFLLYTFIPVFLFRNKYLLFVASFCILIMIDCTGCYFSGMLYLHQSLHIAFDQITFDANKYNTVVNGIFLPATIFAIAGGIKLAKKWYLEQKENERLAREKISRELQLLKTQIHPRFLFHALATVKTHVRTYSPLSGSLIIQLSELLSYILYESDKKFLPVEKETDIIKNYIGFEKKSTADKLVTEINISGDANEKYISPLILLSFIEICFDCFEKDTTKDPSLKLTIKIWNEHLDYHLICNRFLDDTIDPAAIKMRFLNLEKQLHFLYPGNHRIGIITNSSDITIVLNLPVHHEKKEDLNGLFVKNELHELS
jgi:hypothetical protein